MSARAVTLWFIDTADPAALLAQGVTNDVTAAQRLASTIYRDSVVLPTVDTTLAAAMDAGGAHIYAGHYGRLSVLSCSLFATDRPSELSATVASIQETPVATLLHTDPVTGVGAFARWEDGQLRRGFAATPVDIIEDQGLPYPYERPFWAGEYPLQYAAGVAPDPLALPFHPQQLAEESNRAWLGFRFTHPLAPTDLDPARIPVTGYTIHPSDYVPTPADIDRYHAASARGATAPDTTTVHTPDAAPDQPRTRSRLARYFGLGGTN